MRADSLPAVWAVIRSHRGTKEAITVSCWSRRETQCAAYVLESGPRRARWFSRLSWRRWVQGSTNVARAQSSSTALTQPEVLWAYVGTYTGGGGTEKSQGIYLMELDLRTGKLSTPQLVAKSTDPSFLAIDPAKKFLYSVNELGEFRGRRGGGSSCICD